MDSTQRVYSGFVVRTPEGDREIDAYSDEGLAILADLWTRSGWRHRLSYEVTWLGVPIIQLPDDMVILQEIIWRTRPTVIVESGVAHGGALVLYASILELIGRGRVIGVDVEIRKYNRLTITNHPLSKRIHLVEGNSTDPVTFAAVREMINPGDRVMVALDSNHTRAHVAAELELYAPLVSPNCYLVVFDGVMQQVYDSPTADKRWETDNPLVATQEFIANRNDFVVDATCERLRVTYCRNGFLRRVSEE